MWEHVGVGVITRVVLDVSNLTVGGAFWGNLLGAQVIERNDQYLNFGSVAGVPGLSLQRVPEMKEGKNRVHVDLAVADPDQAARLVVELGGSVIREVDDPEERFIVVADSDGNEFCLEPQYKRR
jgi:predicted enzyme related to lactoylglutathione lyase